MTMPTNPPPAAAPPADGTPPPAPPANTPPAPSAPPAGDPPVLDAGQANGVSPQADVNGQVPDPQAPPATPPEWASMPPTEAMQHADFAEARQALEDTVYNRWRGDNSRLTQHAAETQRIQAGIRESLQKAAQDVSDAIADKTFGDPETPAVRTIMREVQPFLDALENQTSQVSLWEGINRTVQNLLDKAGVTGGARETLLNQVEDVRTGGSVDVLGNILKTIGKTEYDRGREAALAEVGEAGESNTAIVQRHQARVAGNPAPPALPAGAAAQKQYTAKDLAGMTREQMEKIPREQRHAAIQIGQP